MSPRFQLQLDRERYAPGDAVKGSLLILEGGSSRSLEAMLQYKEETADYSEVAVSISTGPLMEGDLTAGTSADFELGLPPDALPNYESRNGALYWEVDVRSDEFGRDTHERKRIQVGPPESDLADSAEATALRAEQPTTTVRPATGRAKGERRGLLTLVVLGFFAAGVVALVLGAVLVVRTAQFVSGAEHATGTVVDLRTETDSEGDESFYPVVRFTTAEGKEIEFVSSTGSNPASESPGDHVDVLYDPDDPDDAELSGFFNLWLFPLVTPLLGAIFVAVAWFVRRQTRRR